MRCTLPLLATASLIAFVSPALAQEASPQADVAATTDQAADSQNATGQDIVVTARRREERLQDIPIAVTAVSGDTIKEQQITLVKDVAAYSPGVNINSDSVGRAFVSIRGVGTTLIDTVQPGVGIFIDGIYQPNTTYLNSPLVDVARVEILRGPQGTLFGNNTLGGAINIVTRVPTNRFEGRIDGSLASGDKYRSLSGSVSGPIVRDVLQFRIGAAYHSEDGFTRNSLLGGPTNPLDTRSVNGTLRFLPTDWAVLTLNGSYDRVAGGSVPYQISSGPRHYDLDGAGTNAPSTAEIDYYGTSLKGEFDAASINTKITALGAFYQSNTSSFGDGDFTPIDFLRATNDRTLKTRTGELRFDTKWSDSVSTLVGVFADKSTTDQFVTTTLVPFALTIPSTGDTSNRNRAIFGTAFIKLGAQTDLAVGARYDKQKLDARTSAQLATYKANEFQPRVSLSHHFSRDLMAYATVAKGVRGGGQNEPNAPNVLYKGDSVWTYEVGAKLTALESRLIFNTALFYNDYKDFIGPNALAPAAGGGFVAINLNAGKVKSYGAEFEASYRVSPDLRLWGNLTLLHARVTDSSQFFATTGYEYPGDRILFVPDYNYSAGVHYEPKIAANQSVFFDGTIIGKGERTGGSLNIASVPKLPAYQLVNTSIGYRNGGFEIAAFAQNLFNEKYLESYLDASLLGRAGLPGFLVNNLSIQGNRRRLGIRTAFRF